MTWHRFCYLIEDRLRDAKPLPAMRSTTLFAVCLATILLVPAVQSTATTPNPSSDVRITQPRDVWLMISDDGRCLFIEDGHVVRFEGRGELEFGEDRRKARVIGDAAVFVDGQRVSGDREVRYAETVEIRSGDSQWIIQTVSGGLPDGQGTRISDENPDSEARVESDDHLVFFLRATANGGADFFYPKMSS